MAWNNTNILCCISLNQKFGIRFTGLNARCLQGCISLWNIDGRICSLPFPVSRYCSYFLDHSTSSSTFEDKVLHLCLPSSIMGISLTIARKFSIFKNIFELRSDDPLLPQGLHLWSHVQSPLFMSVNVFPCPNVTVWMSKWGMESVHYSLYNIMLRILGLLLKVSKIIEGVVAENG